MTEQIFSELIGAAIDGEPTRVQCGPKERDPVCNETAEEAWESFKRRGLVNPFHAVEMQRRQNEERRESDASLMDRLRKVDAEGRSDTVAQSRNREDPDS